MASRLRRWTLATGGAVIAIMVATLPPGPPTVVLLFPLWEQPERTGIDGRLQAIASAVTRTEWNLKVARVRTALAPERLRGTSPVVLRLAEGAAVARVDAELTARLTNLWKSHGIPTDRVRTVLVHGPPAAQLSAGLPRAPGICFARVSERFELRRGLDVLGASAGRCAIESRFGAPGEGVRRWADSVGPLWVPEASPWRDPVAVPVMAGVQLAEWAVGNRPTSEGRVPWWAGRMAIACGKGRAEFCREAVGLGGWIPQNTRNGRFGLVYPGELPAALLSELGPDRFGELWRSDAPIPESFERITGAPFDPWAMEFVQRRIGRVERPTGLELGGWVGWIFWVGLLTGWLAIRLRSSPAR